VTGCTQKPYYSLYSQNVCCIKVHSLKLHVFCYQGEGKLKDHLCSEWASSELLPLVSEREESELIANLKAHIAKLQQELKLKNEKLVVS
jgi:hypothetical protein